MCRAFAAQFETGLNMSIFFKPLKASRWRCLNVHNVLKKKGFFLPFRWRHTKAVQCIICVIHYLPVRQKLAFDGYRSLSLGLSYCTDSSAGASIEGVIWRWWWSLARQSTRSPSSPGYWPNRRPWWWKWSHSSTS